MKSKQSSSNEYIPPKVFTQILVNLPVKSLLRFRCVCKSWRTILDNPDFVDMHIQFYNHQNKINSDKILSLEGLGLYGRGGCLLTLRKADTLCKTSQIFECPDSYYLHGSCNSLLLISRPQNFLYEGMRLYNPSIRKSLLLPRCPLLPRYECHTTYVLGFVPRTKDFKVIAISLKRPGVVISEMRLAVYTLSDQRWVVRDNGFNFDCLSNTHSFGPCYFSEGATHWLGKDPCENNSNRDWKPTHLVSLDFDTESFTFLKLPHASPEAQRRLFLLGESLTFFCISPVSLKIWVLKYESGMREWTLWFSGPSSSDGFNMFFHWGCRTRLLYYKGDGEHGGTLVYENKSYNIATCEVQSIAKPSFYVELETYSESLILCKGYKVEDMPSSPFCLDK
ncbi:F-box/kelch-repeat protein At3g23880-like [Silene latifolia]|uniref:F-box/kelch-repeat protein At3g23880-like n=1 Tax=Silene latifolia TaxID=37657 RepID=UPI003D77F79B